MKRLVIAIAVIVLLIPSVVVNAQKTFEMKGFAFDQNKRGANIASAACVAGGSLFVAGTARSPGGGTSFVLRAYEISDGKLIWADRYEGEKGRYNGAECVSAAGDRIFAAGAVSISKNGFAFAVRGYDKNSGKVLWTDTFDGGGGKVNWARALAATRDIVIVAGVTSNARKEYAFTVRAHNAADGKLLWSDIYRKAGEDCDGATALTVSEERVVAVGTTSTKKTRGIFTVRAYNASTGKVLWTDESRPGFAYDVTSIRGGIAAAGSLKGGEVFGVRAYNASTGKVLWTHAGKREGEASENEQAYGIASSGDKVFAAGSTARGCCESFTVRAYDAAKGRLLWAKYYRSAGTRLGSAAACSVVAFGDRALAGGEQSERDDNSVTKFIVRSHDRQSGKLIWSDSYSPGGTGEAGSTVNAVTASGGRVFAVGSVGSAFAVAAYDIASGKRLWTDRYEP